MILASTRLITLRHFPRPLIGMEQFLCFYLGGELAQSRLGLPSSITGVYQGLLLFFILACDTMIFYRLSWRGLSADAGKEVR